MPATITPAYLNRVLAELNHIDGEAFRDARAHNAATPTYLADEEAIRANESEVQLQRADLQKYISSGFAEVSSVPGDISMTVTRQLAAPPPCELAAVSVDFSALTATPVNYPPWYVALVPRTPDASNPTGWAFADDGFEPNGAPPTPSRACAY